MLHTQHKRMGLSRRGREGDIFASALQEGHSLLRGIEDTSKLHTAITPLGVAGYLTPGGRWPSHG